MIKRIAPHHIKHLFDNKTQHGKFNFVEIITESLGDKCKFDKEHVIIFKIDDKYFRAGILENKDGELSFENQCRKDSSIYCDEVIPLRDGVYVYADIHEIN